MPFIISVTVADEKGAESRTEVNVPNATAWADVLLFAGEVTKLISALTTGAITRVGVTYELVLSSIAGITTTPAVGSDVEEGARFQFLTAGGFPTAIRLATFDESKINAGSKDVDLTDGDVSTFLAAMTAGLDLVGVGGSGTISPTDKRDEDIVSTKYAREQFMSSRG